MRTDGAQDIRTADSFPSFDLQFDWKLLAGGNSGVKYLIQRVDEWTNKAAGFIGYGGTAGARAVEHLRLVLAELQVATVRAQVGLSMLTDFENFRVFKPSPHHEGAVNAMLDQVIAWGGALRALREKQAVAQ